MKNYLILILLFLSKNLSLFRKYRDPIALRKSNGCDGLLEWILPILFAWDPIRLHSLLLKRTLGPDGFDTSATRFTHHERALFRSPRVPHLMRCIEGSPQPVRHSPWRRQKRAVLAVFLNLVIASNVIGQTSSSGQTSTTSSTSMSSGLFNTIEQGGKQLLQGFGYCPDSFTYTMQVWNDLSSPVDVDLQKVVSVQGTKFNSSIVDSQNINAYSSSDPTKFNAINICHGITEIAAANSSFYSRPFDVAENDDNTYFYHTFQTSESPGPEGEFLGPGMYGGPYITIDQFDGVFFNHTPYEAQLSFKKNGETYSISLEAVSFNLLSSDSWIADSIRSSTETRNFTISVNGKQFTIPVNALGLGDTFYDATSSTTNNIPLTNTYEIYANQGAVNVVTQGFNMGNHHQVGLLDISASTTPTPSTLAAIRDINPVSCYAWLMTPSQYTAAQQQQQSQSSSGQSAQQPDPSQIPYYLPGSIWAAYKTSDYQTSMQLNSGTWQNNNFQIIRPQVAATIGYVYIFNLNTTNSQQATQFLTNTLSTSDLASTLVSTAITNNQIPSTLGTQLLPNTNGIITDAKSAVTGTLLLIDSFVPYGGGIKASRYYQIVPGILQADSVFASVVTSNLDPTVFNADKTQAAASMLTDFQQNIVGWLTTFNQNVTTINPSQITLSNAQTYASQLQGLVPELTSYLQAKGLSSLFTNPTASGTSRTFSSQGISTLYLILFGPLSLNAPPFIQQPGVIASLGLSPGQMPSGWPSS